MTQNQINYFKAVNDAYAQQRELSETERSHRESERLSSLNYAETRRSNLAREQETSRSNLAREMETARNNREVLSETRRSNQAREIETNRSNVARERETERANRASEAAQVERNRISLLTTQEAQRHNFATEQEASRANRAAETLTSQRNTEAERSNIASEAIRYADISQQRRAADQRNAVDTYSAITNRNTQEQNKIYQSLQTATAKAQVQETERHNKATEAIQRSQNRTSAITSIVSTLGNVVSRGLGSLIGRSVK